MDTYTLDQLYGPLSTFEISKFEELQNVEKEGTFKVTKKIEDVPKTINDPDGNEANFVRRLNKGFEKYKGKLPLKCFDCERIGHYATRCTFREDDYKRLNDDNKRKDNYRRDDRNKIING